MMQRPTHFPCVQMKAARDETSLNSQSRTTCTSPNISVHQGAENMGERVKYPKEGNERKHIDDRIKLLRDFPHQRTDFFHKHNSIPPKRMIAI